MTKRILSILLICVLMLTSCTSEVKQSKKIEPHKKNSNQEQIDKEISLESSNKKVNDKDSKSLETQKNDIINSNDMVNISRLNDPKLLQYIEDQVYAQMTDQFNSDNYRIESIDAIYISKEYLEEIQYNSKKNIYFGYTLSELDSQYNGERYVFTLGDDGKTITKVFEKYDDTYDQIIENVLIGTGVILVCVTVSVISGGIGAPPCITTVFAVSAKTGAICAASTGTISFANTAIVKGIETGNVDETLKEATLAGSEGFKWGAITGVVTGGISKSLSLIKSARTVPKWAESELKVLESIKGGKTQMSYLNGKKVSYFTKDCTRPDIVVENVDGTVKAIEVKNYDLIHNKASLLRELERQIKSRVKNLPKGSKQEIYLDVRGRKYSKKFIRKIVEEIQKKCSPFYENIPVNIVSY